MSYGYFLGKRTLLVGEAGSGKTRFLAGFLDYLVDRGLAGETTLIEMAPNRVAGIGGGIEEYTLNVWKVRYLKPGRVWAPRLLGKSREEVIRYAEENRDVIKPLLQQYISHPTPILLINDITIYLHAGEPQHLIQAIELSNTFMATAYRGKKLEDDKGSGITWRERRGLKALRHMADEVVEFP